MDLHRRERQLLRDLGVLDLGRLVERLALHPLGDERAGGDRRAAAVGLEARVLDAAVGAYLDLQLHHVAAGGCADHAGAHRVVALVERADVARVFVMVDDFVAVCHFVLLSAPPTGRCSDRYPLYAFPKAAKAPLAWPPSS